MGTLIGSGSMDATMRVWRVNEYNDEHERRRQTRTRRRKEEEAAEDIMEDKKEQQQQQQQQQQHLEQKSTEKLQNFRPESSEDVMDGCVCYDATCISTVFCLGEVTCLEWIHSDRRRQHVMFGTTQSEIKVWDVKAQTCVSEVSIQSDAGAM